jgi:hypothetical protein
MYGSIEKAGSTMCTPANMRLSAEVRRALRAQRTACCSGSIVAMSLFLLDPDAVAAPFPAEFELSNLLAANGGDGSKGFVLSGSAAQGTYYEFSASTAGDVNGDGLDDLLVGAYFAGPGGRANAGMTFVVFGRDGETDAFPPEFDLTSLLSANGGDGTRGFVVNGIRARDVSGYAATAAGDVNGDGIGDLIIGAFYASPGARLYAGESYVVFGRNTRFPAEIELSSLLPANGGDGSTGFIMPGINRLDDEGSAVNRAGDVNGDGIDDLIVGAPGARPHSPYDTGVGQSYVIFGRQGAHGFPPVLSPASLLPENGGDGTKGFVVNGVEHDDYAGSGVAGAGDVNGDGIDDILIGARDGNIHEPGQAYVLFGRNVAQAGPFPAVIELSTLLPGNGGDGSVGFVLNGIDDNSFMGRAVAGIGDFNSDGVDDVIMGAHTADVGVRSRAGQSYVVFGRDTAMSGAFAPVIEMSSLLAANGGDGSVGFVLNGIDEDDFAGRWVSDAGDLDGDGNADLAIGAFGADPGGRGEAGETYVVFGHASQPPPELELSTLAVAGGGDGRTGFVLNGSDAGEGSGGHVAGLGDVNGDGVTDLIIAACCAGEDGRAYVVFGRSVFDTDSDGDGINDPFDNCAEVPNPDQRDTNADGIGNACDPDLNGDCFVNFLDLGLIKKVFFSSDPDADLDGDGSVNFGDLGLMKAQFFEAPGPSGLPNACEP